MTDLDPETIDRRWIALAAVVAFVIAVAGTVAVNLTALTLGADPYLEIELSAGLGVGLVIAAATFGYFAGVDVVRWALAVVED